LRELLPSNNAAQQGQASSLHGCRDPDHKDVKVSLPADWIPASCRDDTSVVAGSHGGESRPPPLTTPHRGCSAGTAVKGLILLAPALKLRYQLIARMSRWFEYMHWISKSFKWYKQAPHKNYAKYESFCFNSGFQAFQLVQETQKLLNSTTKLPQIFIAISAHDEVVTLKGAYDFFIRWPDPTNRMLIYSSTPLTTHDPRITVRNSYFPEQKILDFAHNSIPVAPDNPHYGVHGDYQDFNHYPNAKPPIAGEIYFGSFYPKNIMNHVMQRLTYNPDFYQMMGEIYKSLKI
jgi:hypothetical protein